MSGDKIDKQRKLDEIIEQKIYGLIDRQLRKFIKPDFTLDEVKDVNYKLARKLKSKYGIGGIILDVDDTVRKNMMSIPDCNKDWIDFMKREFKVVILTNGCDKRVGQYANRKEIPYIQFAKKPLKHGFHQACNMMGLDPENVLVIGNDIICDILGGKLAGTYTAIVSNVNTHNKFER